MQAAGRRSTFFEQEALDHIVTMMVELSTELWVTRERLYAVEAVLGAADPSFGESIARWEPDASQAAELAAMRTRMLGEVFRALEIERPGPD